MKVSTLATWACVSLLTLFMFINWNPERIALLPGHYWDVDVPLSLTLAASAGLGFAMANFVRMMNKDKGGDHKKK